MGRCGDDNHVTQVRRCHRRFASWDPRPKFDWGQLKYYCYMQVTRSFWVGLRGKDGLAVLVCAKTIIQLFKSNFAKLMNPHLLTFQQPEFYLLLSFNPREVKKEKKEVLINH